MAQILKIIWHKTLYYKRNAAKKPYLRLKNDVICCIENPDLFKILKKEAGAKQPLPDCK